MSLPLFSPRRCFFVLLCALFLVLSVSGQSRKEAFPFRNPKLSIEDRVKDLLGRMTLQEKIGQLQCEIKGYEGVDTIILKNVGNLATLLRGFEPREAADKANRIQKIALEKTRLGIPVIIHDEALHGLIGNKATGFPQSIALAASWDPELVEKIGTVIGRQTHSRGINQVLSPVVNIARDVRWGRVEETYGEDPFLSARMGVAFCRPIEAQAVVTTPKHYVANVGDGGRDSHVIEISETQVREVYFPPFKACFQEGNATSVMAAYNSYNGLPCSSNRWLLTDVLRKEWGFKGFVVSDYGSVGGIRDAHRTAANEKLGAKQAVEAGMDVELPGIYLFGKPLLDAVKEGLVSESTIDTAATRVLAAKFRLGLFDKPYVDPAEAARLNDTPEDRALALRAAHESIVLLKNENSVLPLAKSIKSIALIGPNADAVNLGGYSGFGMKVVTPLEGIKSKLPSALVRYAKGCELTGASLPPVPAENLFPPAAKEGEHGLKGEYYNNMDLSGTPALVRIDKELNFDWQQGSPDPKIHSDHFSARWTGRIVPPASATYRFSITTDDGVRVYMDGKRIVDSWSDRAPTSDFFTVTMEAGRGYDLRIEYYENGGGAAASLGWNVKKGGDRDVQEAVDAAKASDVAIIVPGILEGEGRDRAELQLPGMQEDLIRAVAATGVPTVVVLVNGSAVTMSGWIDQVPSIVEAWYSGEEGGNAIADVLFGDYNPGGKLPITFPQYVGQCPLYYNLKPSGRGYDYVDMSGKPLFPFGYGLSYTKFDYSNLRMSSPTIWPTDSITISVDIKNAGSRRGHEVVELYLHDVVGSVVRPLKELKAFRRISLDPGEQQTVRFVLGPADLAFLDRNLRLVVGEVEHEVMIGSSSEDIRVKGSFGVVK